MRKRLGPLLTLSKSSVIVDDVFIVHTRKPMIDRNGPFEFLFLVVSIDRPFERGGERFAVRKHQMRDHPPSEHLLLRKNLVSHKRTLFGKELSQLVEILEVHVLPNVQDEPRPWPARLVLLGARGVTAMVVGSGALLGGLFIVIGARRREPESLSTVYGSSRRNRNEKADACRSAESSALASRSHRIQPTRQRQM